MLTERKHKIAQLVGDRIILQCSINNTRIPILMAARAQVTINEERYLRENFPHLKINPVKDLLQCKDSLMLQSGNSPDLPFKGFENLEVSLVSCNATVQVQKKTSTRQYWGSIQSKKLPQVIKIQNLFLIVLGVQTISIRQKPYRQLQTWSMVIQKKKTLL